MSRTDLEAFPLFLLNVYAKNQQANLTKAERNELKQLVSLLVKIYSKDRQRRKSKLHRKNPTASAVSARKSSPA
jgi:hypothetical protein